METKNPILLFKQKVIISKQESETETKTISSMVTKTRESIDMTEHS